MADIFKSYQAKVDKLYQDYFLAYEKAMFKQLEQERKWMS